MSHQPPAIPRPQRPARLAVLALLCATSACTGIPVPGLGEPEVTQVRSEAPPGAPEGSCWNRDFTPAVIETVTEQVLATPEVRGADGSVIQPAGYRSEVRQTIVQERHEVWFRTPCEAELTAEFIASLQRALSARGVYDGAATGVMDNATRAAVRRYQRPRGLDSGILSLAVARQFGLLAVEEAPESLVGDVIPVLPIEG
ncbi:peptidoglycan-binding domain-containing protein [Pseudooceanicola nanhaiensis]|uniref:peptidoglycan-binding domain-containing protein n=1 Tax=Pseudooceanicola nanhaiensis TaxID=375761 RepID=UPI001CD340B0|nr:peptidoglycan-binding domain-containing protein [Pseudooceanicola nanhaiensis]MCA0922066.1 peptidoglycan-binding protein [Pseudooceanicola nanhaiensis]